MVDRRTQRIREQLRQHPNPRAGRPSAPLSLVDQMRQIYNSSPLEPTPSRNPHSQLAQRFQSRRKG